ncbi:hypothetical protein H072_1808 [Dactylellina haptotyla CBS 200.50]|uniref:Ubiquitin 3 binding protein But2 C-terminal domain-containing protein n=1 Tax=Dactylellina haptotyla (strain CBS 200.50) TaxID=1284197 RepID=S8AT83_DACHA|nr:hypothetical protein H072_1808 [Dactylellina haptotyla CBS 200.50]
MRFPIDVLLLVGAAAAAATANCNADNCLRAIRATAFPTRPGTADCSSYFRATVTPATVTITEITTLSISFTETLLTKTVIRPSEDSNTLTLEKRQATVIPSSIPAYASPCSGAVRYESACSCIGVTRTTITVATPSTTITQTSTTSVTTTTEAYIATATARSFLMQVQDHYPGAYAKGGFGAGVATPEFTFTKSEATKFFIDPVDSTLWADGFAQCQTYNNGADTSFIYLDLPSAYDPLTCAISDVDNVISCTSGLFTQFGTYGFNFSLFMGYETTNWANWGGEGPVTVKAIPLD